jgi:2-polyprenyl-3-methyl-5-hydroxy-6-metoxy-1,4-benzoquinol methylase
LSANHTKKYLLKPIIKIIKTSKVKTILDFGCGNGWLTELLINEGYDAYGVDNSVSGIELANKRLPGKFFVVDAEKDILPIELNSKSFDMIISSEVIEHLYSPRNYISFCKKILEASEKKLLVLTTPYHGYLKNIFLSVSGKMDNHFTALWDHGHIKFWSRDTITQLLKEYGFNINEFTGCGRIPFLWKSMIIKATLTEEI